MRRVVHRSAILLLILASAAQQKPPIPSIGETIEVSLVNLDVFVTNKAGERVRGLGRDDFEVFENGVTQPITNFAEYAAEGGGAPPTTAVTGPTPAPQRQPRTIVVFIERFFLPPFRTEPFFASLKTMLHTAIRPGDRAMIATWNRGIMLTQQQFTDSLPDLDRAIDGLAKLSSQRIADIRDETRAQIAFAQSFDDYAVSTGGATANGDGIADMELQSIAMMEKQNQQAKVRAINAVMRTIAAAEGKKALILVTHRLSRVAGAENYYQSGRNVNDLDQLDKRAAADMTASLKTIDDTANANGITVYPLFPEGLESSMSDSSQSAAVDRAEYQTLNNEMHALTEIAEETGGLTASGTDATKLLGRVSDDLDAYYSLAYRARTTGVDKARKVVVKTKDPSLVVRTRREFLEKSDTTRMEDRVIAALFHNPPTPGFPLHVAVGRREARGKQFRIPLTIHIPISALTQLPEASQYAGAFSVYFAWGGKIGGISDTSRETRNYAIPAAQYAQARKDGHLTYQIQLAVDRKTERVAFGVVDEIGKDYALRLMNVR